MNPSGAVSRWHQTGGRSGAAASSRTTPVRLHQGNERGVQIDVADRPSGSRTDQHVRWGHGADARAAHEADRTITSPVCGSTGFGAAPSTPGRLYARTVPRRSRCGRSLCQPSRGPPAPLTSTIAGEPMPEVAYSIFSLSMTTVRFSVNIAPTTPSDSRKRRTACFAPGRGHQGEEGRRWLARKDSNLQSPDPESGALPLGHSPAMPVGRPSLPRDGTRLKRGVRRSRAQAGGRSEAPGAAGPRGQAVSCRPCACSFAQVSLRVSVRLNTSAPGADSGSRQK